jgi:pyruvate/2-oxoglutarate dehydrogenase complex dihydrolipoamide dehydrogenase (E3) component
VGCLPTKTLLRSAKLLDLFRDSERFGIRNFGFELDFRTVMERSDALIEATVSQGPRPFEEQGVEYFHDHASFLSPHELQVGERVLRAERFIIATGQLPAIPPIPGLREAGFITNEQATHLRELPRSLIILGGGAIGLEFAQIFSAFGCEVTVLEAANQILPRDDEDIARLMVGYLEERVVRVSTQTRAIAMRREDERKVVTAETPNGRRDMVAEEILVATGRTPNVQGLNLEAAGVTHDRRGITVDETMQTNVPHVWAAGDLSGKWLFTHVAAYEGQLAGHNATSTRPRKADYRIVPRVTFTDPEVASVGFTEQEARETGIPVTTTTFPFQGLPKAVIDGQQEGMVKLVAVEGSGEIIGGHIVGPEASTLIHEIVIAMAGPLPADVVRHTIHAFPTYSEAVRWAAGGIPVDKAARVGCILCLTDVPEDDAVVV